LDIIMSTTPLVMSTLVCTVGGVGVHLLRAAGQLGHGDPEGSLPGRQHAPDG
jgi:hypothetical protein